jgi:hypothetical protein
MVTEEEEKNIFVPPHTRSLKIAKPDNFVFSNLFSSVPDPTDPEHWWGFPDPDSESLVRGKRMSVVAVPDQYST